MIISGIQIQFNLLDWSASENSVNNESHVCSVREDEKCNFEKDFCAAELMPKEITWYGEEQGGSSLLKQEEIGSCSLAGNMNFDMRY